LAHQWEVEGEPPKIGERITVTGWKDAFLEDAKSRNLNIYGTVRGNVSVNHEALS
jgi:hypothetical protein